MKKKSIRQKMRPKRLSSKIQLGKMLRWSSKTIQVVTVIAILSK